MTALVLGWRSEISIGLAAHFAVFHVRLFRHGKIQNHGDGLPAVGAGEKVFHCALYSNSLQNIAETPSGVIDFRVQFNRLCSGFEQRSWRVCLWR